jgi:hypothetical protein
MNILGKTTNLSHMLNYFEILSTMASKAEISLVTEYICSENSKDSPLSDSTRKRPLQFTSTPAQGLKVRLEGETRKASGRPV